MSLVSVAFKTLTVCAATVVLSVHTLDGRALEGAVITVHATNGLARPAAPVRAIMDQVNRTFVPDVLVVPVGSTVEFPNSDSVSHQIYSFSAAKRFQLPLYHGKPYAPVLFEQPGLVTLGCNIHDFMLAYVLVTDAPFFGRSDSSGSWSTDLARGTYRITVWHPRMHEDGTLRRELSVGEDDRVTLSLRLDKSLQPAPLGTHPHSWDAY